MSDEPLWQCLISEPDGSIRLPVWHGLDAVAWSKEAAQAYLGASAPRGTARKLSSLLADLTATAELSDPTFAYAYVVDAARSVVAFYEVHAYADDADFLSVDRLPDMIQQVLPSTPDRREVTKVDLPAGTGVRIQEIQSVGGSLFKKKTQMESVTYALLPSQVDNILVFRMSWTNLIFGKGLLELAHTLAESLELAQAQEA